MPPKPSKSVDRKGAAAKEPVPMDPKAASRAIGRQLDKERSTRILKNAPPSPAAKPAPKPPAQAKPRASAEPATRIAPPARAPAPPPKPASKPAVPARAKPPAEPNARETRIALQYKTPAPPPPPAKPVPRPAVPAKAGPPPAGASGEPRIAAQPPAPPAPRAVPKAPVPPPAAAATEEVFRGAPIDNKVLLLLLEDTPGSLLEVWIRFQLGEAPERALKSSRTEVEFLVLQKNLAE